MSTVTDDEIQRVREWECLWSGHSWTVLESYADGPFKVICGHCGKDSGLVRLAENPVVTQEVHIHGDAAIADEIARRVSGGTETE